MHFDQALRETPYDRFVDRLDAGTPLAGFLMTPDAAFGYERAGTPASLGALGRVARLGRGRGAGVRGRRAPRPQHPDPVGHRGGRPRRRPAGCWVVRTRWWARPPGSGGSGRGERAPVCAPRRPSPRWEIRRAGGPGFTRGRPGRDDEGEPSRPTVAGGALTVAGRRGSVAPGWRSPPAADRRRVGLCRRLTNPRGGATGRLPGVGEAFFTEVPGPIRVRRPGLDRPARVQGLRSPTGWSSASGWRTTSGPACASGTRSPGRASTCSASGRSTGRGSPRRPTRWTPRAHEDGRRVRVLREARHAVLLLPRPRRRPGGRRASPTFRANLDALADDAAGYQERTGTRLLWGTANLFTHPRYQAGAATNPDPEVFAYAAAQVKHMLEVTQRLGGAELRPVGRPRGLRHAAQHRPPARGRPARPVPAPGRRAQAQDRLQGPAADRAQADGADQAPVRLRRRDGARLPGPQRARGRVPHQHRGQPRDARRAQLPPRGRVRGRQRDAGQHRRQPRRPAERLGHRPVPELRRGPRRCRCTRSCARGGIAPGGFNFDAKLRRQSTDRNDLFHAHIGGLDTLARALLVAADLVERGELAGLKDRRYAGWDGELGTAILGGSLSLADLEARVADGSIDPGRSSGSQERLENLVNQAIWAVDRPRQA